MLVPQLLKHVVSVENVPLPTAEGRVQCRRGGCAGCCQREDVDHRTGRTRRAMGNICHHVPTRSAPSSPCACVVHALARLRPSEPFCADMRGSQREQGALAAGPRGVSQHGMHVLCKCNVERVDWWHLPPGHPPATARVGLWYIPVIFSPALNGMMGMVRTLLAAGAYPPRGYQALMRPGIDALARVARTTLAAPVGVHKPARICRRSNQREHLSTTMYTCALHCPCWPRQEPFDEAEIHVLTYMKCILESKVWSADALSQLQQLCMPVQRHRVAYVLSTSIFLRRNNFSSTLLRHASSMGENFRWLLQQGVCPQVGGSTSWPYYGWHEGSKHPGRPPEYCLLLCLTNPSLTTTNRRLLLACGAYPPAGSSFFRDQCRQWHAWHGRASRRRWLSLDQGIPLPDE